MSKMIFVKGCGSCPHFNHCVCPAWDEVHEEPDMQIAVVAQACVEKSDSYILPKCPLGDAP